LSYCVRFSYSLSHIPLLSAPPPPEISTLSLHDALPIWNSPAPDVAARPIWDRRSGAGGVRVRRHLVYGRPDLLANLAARADRLRSEEHTSEPSHVEISYAVFCLKKKNKNKTHI